MEEKTWWWVIVPHQVGWFSSRLWLVMDGRLPEIEAYKAAFGSVFALITFVLIRVLWAGAVSLWRSRKNGIL